MAGTLASGDLEHVSDWVFDLDNTLYPAHCDLFAEIDARMTDFVARFLRVEPHEARGLQKRYYAEHGTTLKGLMTLHGMDPGDFLAHVHEVDLSPLPVCERLRDAIAALPGRKLVYTNGSRRHAERVTRHMQIDHLFHAMSGIEDAGFHPKPDQRSYDAFCEAHSVEPGRAIFFEDMERNLKPAHAMGFTTVLVRSDAPWVESEPEGARPASPGDDLGEHIHYVTDDLTEFLTAAMPATD
jgi:putative hydrolase of the HAD superfamily